jgi:hypothetical protein
MIWYIPIRIGWLRRTALLAVAIWGVSNGGELSPHQRASVATIASSRPCLATALLYVTVRPMESARGTLQFEGFPTSRSVMFLLDTAGGDSLSNDMVSAWNPYTADPSSAPVYMVEVRWTLAVLGRDGYLLSTRAQIVDGAGQPIVPAHVVEPLTTVFVTGDSFRIVDNGKNL